MLWITQRPGIEEEVSALAEEINAKGTKGLSNVEIKLATEVPLTIISNMLDDEASRENAERRVRSTLELSRRISETA
ncbi:hypothetical protein [Achromobacter kerstersii]|uniref:hypothetical protein n=1 Tax=Achromobacter kerstersii TaxID=1353890 RepID=UPI003CFD1D97